MNILNGITKMFGYEIRKKQARNPLNLQMIGALELMGTNQAVYIKDGYKLNPSIYSIVNWITKKAATIKWILFQDDEKIDDHPFLDLLNNPNPHQGKSEFIENLIGFKLITGESFLHSLSLRTGDKKGLPAELHILPPPNISVKVNSFGEPVKYVLRVGATQTEINAGEMIWFKYWNPSTTDMRGMSPIEAGRRVVTQSNDAYLAALKLLQNLGAQGILTLDDPDIDNMDEAELEKWEQRYYEKYGTSENYGKIMVSNIKTAWTQIGLKATDLALIESQKMSLRDMCNIYNLSSQIFNDPDNKTYNNVREAKRAGILDVIIPELELIVGEFNRFLTIKYGENLRLDFERNFYEIKEDEKALVETLVPAWWLTPNRRLERMGEPTSEDPLMDEIYIPQNLMPLGIEGDQELKNAYNRYQSKNG